MLDHRGELFQRFGHHEDVLGQRGDLLVTGGGHGDDRRLPGPGLGHVGEDLVVHRPAGHDRDQRRVGVEQRDRAVLKLAGGIPLGMNVRQLLELERPFHRDGEADAAADVHHVLHVDLRPAGGDIANLLGAVEGGHRRPG